MNNETLKTAICDALATWIRQRPGLNPRDYEPEGYRQAQREVAIDKRDAEMLLVAVRSRDSITGARLIESAKHAFGGRLEIKVKPGALARVEKGVDVIGSEWQVEIEYTAGQNSDTEYRAAAAAVLASALWEHVRTDESTGDTLRQHFRKEFGSRLQRRWFN